MRRYHASTSNEIIGDALYESGFPLSFLRRKRENMIEIRAGPETVLFLCENQNLVN